MSSSRDRRLRPAPESLTPHSNELEQAILGGLIVVDHGRADRTRNDGLDAVLREGLKPEHFYHSLHGRIFELMCQLGREAKPITVFSLKAFIEDIDLGDGTTPSQYIAKLAGAAVTLVNIPDYARMVVQLSQRRALIAEAAEFQNEVAVAPPDKTNDELAADAIQRIQRLAENGSSIVTRKTIGDAAAEMLTRARLRKEQGPEGNVIPTGFTDLDRMTGGYEGGTLWIAGGRPGMGKTSLMVSSANAIGKMSVRRERDGLPGWGVVEFSLEVSQDQFMSRHVADLVRSQRRSIPFSSIMRGELEDDELWIVEDGVRRFDDMPIIVDFASRLSIAEIALRVKTEKAKFARQGVELKVVFIDYLKFIKASDRYKGQRVYEVGEITVALKDIAKKENICIVLLCQLNRANEARDDKRPGLADLRESGDIEADADVVCFLHREAYYIEKSSKFRENDSETLARHAELVNQAELIIAKNRAGPTRTVVVYANIGCSSLGNLYSGS